LLESVNNDLPDEQGMHNHTFRISLGCFAQKINVMKDEIPVKSPFSFNLTIIYYYSSGVAQH